MVNDPRIAPVEDNLIAFYRDAMSSPLLTVARLDRAQGYYTDIPFPLCNVVFDARFDPDRATAQARAVLAEYTGRGLPFLWWTSPATTSLELEAACAEAGMLRQDVPGMHRALEGPVQVPTLERVALRAAGAPEVHDLTDVMLAGFDMPEWLHDPLVDMFHGLDPAKLVNVLAYLDEKPVASGSAYLTGATAGVYNIATLREHRGQGLGTAVTAWLMNDAYERGCTQTILHASPDGLPVYERLGYETVCMLAQMVWVPAG